MTWYLKDMPHDANYYHFRVQTVGDAVRDMSARKRSKYFSRLLSSFAIALAISPYVASFLLDNFKDTVPSMPALIPLGFTAFLFVIIAIICYAYFPETTQSSHSTNSRPIETDSVDSAPTGGFHQFVRQLSSAIKPRNVWMFIALNGILTMMLTGSEMLVPLLTEESRERQGLGLSSRWVGNFFSIQGAFFAFSQVFIYPILSKQFSAEGGLRIGFAALAFIIPAGFAPALLSSETLITVAMPAIMCLRVLVVSVALTSILICIDQSTPTQTKGVVNGTAQAVASLSRSIGSGLSGVLFDFGRKISLLFLPYGVFGFGLFIGFMVSLNISAPKAVVVDTVKVPMDDFEASKSSIAE